LKLKSFYVFLFKYFAEICSQERVAAAASVTSEDDEMKYRRDSDESHHEVASSSSYDEVDRHNEVNFH